MNDIQSFFLRGNLFCYFLFKIYRKRARIYTSGGAPCMKLFSTSWRLVGVGASFSRSRVEVHKRGRNVSLFLKYLERSAIEVRAIHLSIRSGYF